MWPNKWPKGTWPTDSSSTKIRLNWYSTEWTFLNFPYYLYFLVTVFKIYLRQIIKYIKRCILKHIYYILSCLSILKDYEEPLSRNRPKNTSYFLATEFGPMLDISDPPPPRDRLWEREVMFPCPSVGSGTRGPAVGKWLPFSANTGWSSSCFSSSFFECCRLFLSIRLQVTHYENPKLSTYFANSLEGKNLPDVGRLLAWMPVRPFIHMTLQLHLHSAESPLEYSSLKYSRSVYPDVQKVVLSIINVEILHHIIFLSNMFDLQLKGISLEV